LHGDQITALLRKSTRGLKWCSETIRDALVLKMRCGTSGFSALVKKLPIYPAVRSLQSYVQFITFDFGILEDILNLMEAVVPFFNPFQTDCHLTIDEMAIGPGERMDFSLKKMIGLATLKSHTGFAKKRPCFSSFGSLHSLEAGSGGSSHQSAARRSEQPSQRYRKSHVRIHRRVSDSN